MTKVATSGERVNWSYTLLKAKQKQLDCEIPMLGANVMDRCKNNDTLIHPYHAGKSCSKFD